MAEENRVVIHIGPGKTATTFLQQHIFRAHKQINYIGKNHANDEINKDLAHLVRNDSVRFNSQERCQSFRSEIAAHPDKRAHVLSEELLGTWAFIDAQIMAMRLKEIFGPATIIISIRNVVDWLQSIYFWCLHVGRFNAELEYNDWLAYWLKHPAVGNPLSSLHCRRLAEIYGAVFGAENIRFIVYEDIKRNPAEFASGLANMVGVDGPEMVGLFEAKAQGKKDKPRISQPVADFLRKGALVRGDDGSALANELGKYLQDFGTDDDRAQLAEKMTVLRRNELDQAAKRELFLDVFGRVSRRMPTAPRAEAEILPHLRRQFTLRFGPQFRWIQETYGVALDDKGYEF